MENTQVLNEDLLFTLKDKNGNISARKLQDYNIGNNTNFTPEQFYLLKNNKILCSCGKETTFISYNKGYKKFCSIKCSSNNKEVRAKAKKTSLDRYGDENYCNKDKIKATKLKRYGDENYNNPKLNRKTCVKNGSDIKRVKNIKKTNIIRYGVDNVFASKLVRNIKIEKGLIIEDKHRPDFEIYKLKVRKLSEKNEHNLPNRDKRGLAGKKGTFHLDHKYSIYEGFKNNVPIYIISHKDNLEYIPWEENCKKKTKCSININKIGRI